MLVQLKVSEQKLHTSRYSPKSVKQHIIYKSRRKRAFDKARSCSDTNESNKVHDFSEHWYRR